MYRLRTYLVDRCSTKARENNSIMSLVALEKLCQLLENCSDINKSYKQYFYNNYEIL